MPEKKKSKKIPKGLLVLLAAILLGGSVFGTYAMVKANKVTTEEENLTDILAKADKNNDGSITGDELEEAPVMASVKEKEMNKFQLKQALKPVKCWLRAKVTYTYDEGIEGLNDSLIKFDSLNWKKSKDGWYYYKNEVHDGENITFLHGVHIPTEWTSDVENKHFAVIVTVEAAEVKEGDEGWNENSQVAYRQVYNFLDTNIEKTFTEPIKKGYMTVTIHEYQRNKSGRGFEDYKNDKTVVPGAYVSKLVQFTLHRNLFRTTGDAAMVGMYAGGLALSLILLVSIVQSKKKREGNNSET